MAVRLKDLTKRSENYSQWYNELVVKADLAEQSAVRGCMVIKPYGYAIWEKLPASVGRYVQGNRTRKRLFPLTYSEIIPQSRSGTRGRLCQRVCRSDALSFEEQPNGSSVVVDPAAKLEEELLSSPYFGNYHLEYL